MLCEVGVHLLMLKNMWPFILIKNWKLSESLAFQVWKAVTALQEVIFHEEKLGDEAMQPVKTQAPPFIFVCLRILPWIAVPGIWPCVILLEKTRLLGSSMVAPWAMGYRSWAWEEGQENTSASAAALAISRWIIQVLDFNSGVSEADNFTAFSRTTSPSFKDEISFGHEPELLFVDLRSIQIWQGVTRWAPVVSSKHFKDLCQAKSISFCFLLLAPKQKCSALVRSGLGHSWGS